MCGRLRARKSVASIRRNRGSAARNVRRLTVKITVKSKGQRLWALRNHEIVKYIVAGGLTTLVNVATYNVFNWLLGPAWRVVSLTLSIALSILFAYVMNRYFVFRSRNPVWPEIAYFALSRLVVSFVFEVATFYFIYDVIGFQAELWPKLEYAKLIGQIAVIVGNYFVGKFAIFRNSAAPTADDNLEEMHRP